MLDLVKSYAAYPAGPIHHLVLPHETILVYPSATSIIILNAQSLALVRVLAFSDPFPGTVPFSGAISCLSVDADMNLIVAAMNNRIAAWSLSGVQHGIWRIHATLTLPDGQDVTIIDSNSGLLAVGSEGLLSVYSLILENDLPTWSLKWAVPISTPSFIQFSPSLTFMVVASKCDNVVRTYSTTSGRLVQKIPHPRPVVNLTWRQPHVSSRDDLILYTITCDATLRIFLPVLDTPHYLQLHASLDSYSSLPFSIASDLSAGCPRSEVFWLDKITVDKALKSIKSQSSESDCDDTRTRRIQEIIDEGWDLFLRVLDDGSITITAVSHIDRRPPTILRRFTLQQSLPGTFLDLPSHLNTLPHTDASSITLVTSPPLSTFELFPLSFFDAQPEGLHMVARDLDRIAQEDLEIAKFVRSLDGTGFGTLRANGCGETWSVSRGGLSLVRSRRWASADFVVVLKGGSMFATYSAHDSVLTLHSEPLQQLHLPALGSLFTMPSADGEEYVIGITLSLAIVQIHVDDKPSLRLVSQSSLPLSRPSERILPVDPMAWGLGYSWAQHDILLSISASGELAFWVPEENSGPHWRCSGKVKTGRTGFNRVRCSSAKKTALIVPGHPEELTIWDSHESEFASGLEYRGHYNEPINDLDWTSTQDNQSILAVGFLHRVELLCQQRMTYFDEGPGWTVCRNIDITSVIPYSISDSVWLTDGSLLIGVGNQMLLYGERTRADGRESDQETLFDYVDSQNRPLVDYHPQMLLQCLLWEKIEAVKDIIVHLAHAMDAYLAHDPRASYTPLPVERFLTKGQGADTGQQKRRRYNALFDVPEEQEENNVFSRPLVTRLIKSLEAHPIPHLTRNERAHLLVLIQTTLEIDEQRRALDANGLRYLISMRSFYIINDRAQSLELSGTVPQRAGKRERLRYRDMVWAFHSGSQELLLNASISACNGKMGWSDAKALGISIWLGSIDSLKAQLETIARNEYMAGDNRDPTTCSLLYFALGKVKLVHGLWRQASWHKEQALMLKFLSNNFSEPRWRTAALKNAYALLSKRRFEYAAAFFLLGGSLKDAVNVCIKQIGDFQLAIAITRAVEQSNEGPVFADILKNTVLPIAFREGNRWLAGWAFWLLHRRDLAVRILLTPLRDIADTLDISVDEIGEPHYDDPSLALLFSQLRSKTLQAAKGTSEISGSTEFSFVLQMARVFCRMGCHVLGLDLVQSWSFDRPSTVVHQDIESVTIDHNKVPTSPTTSRRSLFALEPAMRRRSSIIIDMDIPSLPPTRSASPVRDAKPPQADPEKVENISEGGDLLARKAGLGSLMKSAKMDVKVPEFDMNAFF